jgi:hypothetical protein
MVSGTLWLVFSRVEQVASPKAKTSATTWIKRLDISRAIEIAANSFGSAIDAVFGDRHWSFKCLWRSFVASVFYVTVLYLLWISLSNTNGHNISEFEGVMIITVVFCIVPDYVSLLKSRLILRAAKGSSRLTAAFLIVFDGVVSALIALVVLAFAYGIISATTDIMPFHHATASELTRNELRTFVASLPQLLAFQRVGNTDTPPAIWVYTTFMTSTWGWLFFVSGSLLRQQSVISKCFDYVLRFVDIDDKPFLSVGAVSIVMVTMLYTCTFVVAALI